MRDIYFEPKSLTHLQHWAKVDRKITAKILRLLEVCARTPFEGEGKPEPLKENYSGCWSRRIDKEHRLVYRVYDDRIAVISCRYHY